MIKFDKPVNLNGTELVDELNNAGITVNDLPYVDANSDLWLNISESDKSAAESIVSAHNGTVIPPEPTIQDKLANAGITLDELKTALGL